VPINAGVWIDHQQAVVVLISAQSEAVKRIASGIIQHPWPLPASHRRNPCTTNDAAPADRLKRMRAFELIAFYDDVLRCISKADDILIFGRGAAKDEFRNRCRSKACHALIGEPTTVDEMTDRQIAARVREHLSTRGRNTTQIRSSMDDQQGTIR